MRKENAIYGGEMSAHHYFRDFAYCGSGMNSWLLVAELMSSQGKKLSESVGERMAAYPCSGEINYKVGDAKAVIQAVQEHCAAHNPKIDTTDDISLELAGWHMNLHSSNVEPLLCLSIEARDCASW